MANFVVTTEAQPPSQRVSPKMAARVSPELGPRSLRSPLLEARDGAEWGRNRYGFTPQMAIENGENDGKMIAMLAKFQGISKAALPIFKKPSIFADADFG